LQIATVQTRLTLLRPTLLGGMILTLAAIWPGLSDAADPGASAVEGVKFETLAYLDYSYGQTALADDQEADFNRFAVTRGYFTFKKQATPWFSVRYTLDVHQDETGDYKRRDKYLYAEFKPKDTGFFTHLKAEVGMGHMPWLDFEEHINPYRCQGTMAIERAGTFNSADLGVSLAGYLGAELDDAKQRTGNSHYAGCHGSWHLGIYNGGGYHAAENNQNKVLEGRLTVRPAPDALPGLQLSYLGIFGEGNVAQTESDNKAEGEPPDYLVNLGMLSFEHPSLVLTAQYFATEGNAKGSWVAGQAALKTEGYSVFGNFRIPTADSRWSLFGRYDHFDADKDHVIADQTAYDMILGGIVCDVHKGNLLMLVYETTDYEAHAGGKGKIPTEEALNLGKDQKIQVVYQIKL
jgi:hypothetical protein